MTTNQLIERLKPIRSDVSKSRQAVLDKLETGATSDDCIGRLDRWRESVRTYIATLEQERKDLDLDTLESRITELGTRLERGFEMPVPDSTVEDWKINKHFEKLLSELEVCSDLYAGPQATRQWLLTQDARLRMVMRRNDRQRPQVTQEPDYAEEATT